MVVLRCPFCGEKIQQGSQYCNHCGKEIDKPAIDEVDSFFEDNGKYLVIFFELIVFWFVMAIVVGFISNILNLPVNLLTLVIVTVLDVMVVVWINRNK